MPREGGASSKLKRLLLPDKIIPIRIYAFYQSDFPSEVPLFESLLAPNCILDIIVLLKIDKALDSMSFCEPFNSIRLVLEHAPYEIVCDADIKRSANSACKDVDVLAHPSVITDSSGLLDRPPSRAMTASISLHVSGAQ